MAVMVAALVGEDGGLIAGHARILAARQLGIAEIPVMVAAGWSEAQKRAYVLADNQLAITGSGWDPEMLRLELGELKLSGFDLSLTGFGDLELKDTRQRASDHIPIIGGIGAP
jgi:ParB-like chromosome segregation protein Spo0J